MEIRTQQDMIEFCKSVRRPFKIRNLDNLTGHDVAEFEAINSEMIKQGKLSRGSHLQQGIVDLYYDTETGVVIYETPYLYPSPRISAENPKLTGPMTGNLSNCYDTQNKLFLFHMRGRGISAPYRFQAAAAGMGYFRENPRETAIRELREEVGIAYPGVLFNGKAVDVLPFMKNETLPQPLFSFGFVADLSRFPVYHSLDELTEFEAKIKQGLKEGTIEQREAYHFAVRVNDVEEIAGKLNDQQRFHGPIYESTINFLRALVDSSLYPHEQSL